MTSAPASARYLTISKWPYVHFQPHIRIILYKQYLNGDIEKHMLSVKQRLYYINTYQARIFTVVYKLVITQAM